MGDVVIDTDVASVVQKGRAPSWVSRHVAGQRVWLTFVTVAELWKWAEARKLPGYAGGVGVLVVPSARHPLRRRHLQDVGSARGTGSAARSTTASERHVDRRLLRAP